MSVEFIDPQGKFEKLEGQCGRLHYWGSSQAKWPEVLTQLEAGEKPLKLRGNFAYVYFDEHRTFAAVDHISTQMLFYSGWRFSWNFTLLKNSLPSTSEDKRFEWQKTILGGFNITSNTSVKEIQRILPGHYLENEQQKKYINLMDYLGDAKLEPEEFCALLERSLKEKCKMSALLLLSGGTDSSTLAAAVAKLKPKQNIKMLNLYSEQQMYREKEFVEALAEKINLDVEYFSVPKISLGSFPEGISERYFGLWKDRSNIVKTYALLALNVRGRQILTGEIGDQLFGGPKLRYQLALVTQSKSWTARDLARQYLNVGMNNWKSCRQNPLMQIYQITDAQAQDIYDETVSEIADWFEAMPTSDLVNRFLLLNLLIKGPFRVGVPSQSDYDYFHPFADWSLLERVLAARSNSKVFAGGRLKEICFQAYREYLIDSIWEAPKVGTEIQVSR